MKKRNVQLRAALREMEDIRAVFDRKSAKRRRELIAELAEATFTTAADLERFHELLCFIRGYPDDRRTLQAAENVLAGFAKRADLREFREDLENSGIIGTDITYRFFQPMSWWLTQNWPGRLSIDWDEFDNEERLLTLMPLLVHYSEATALDEMDWDARGWIRRMKGRGETDAAFLVRRFHAVFTETYQREKLLDELDPPLRLRPGKGTPARSLARHHKSKVVYRKTPFPTKRPKLESLLRRRPKVRETNATEGQALIDMTRSAMVTRARDLDAFSWADPNDVRIVEFEDGLQFAVIGQTPERRLLFESVYGYLTMKSGTPVGYVLTGCLYNSAEVAYNVFDTYRGAEAAEIYGRVLAMTRHLFGADTFMIPPYQLGAGNQEALRSGAWWFYQKLGFRPDDPDTTKLMKSELARMQKSPRHRSTIDTLDRLSSENLYWSPNPRRRDAMGRLPLGFVGLAVMNMMAERFGSDREGGIRALVEEAVQAVGLDSIDDFSPGERLAWERWAPIIGLIRGVKRWSTVEKRALVKVVRAKGGPRESDYVKLFDRHVKLRNAVARIAREAAG